MVRTPAVQNRSLIASGMPSSGAVVAGRERLVGAPRPRARLLGGDGEVGVQPRVEPLDRVQMRGGQLARQRRPSAQRRRGACGRREIGQHHSTTFGTAKNAPGAVGRVGQHLRPGCRHRSRRPRASAAPCCAAAGQRLDALDVDLVQLLDPAEDAVQLGLQPGDVVLLQMRRRASLAMRRTVAGSSDMGGPYSWQGRRRCDTGGHGPVQHGGASGATAPGPAADRAGPGQQDDRGGAVRCAG